VSVDLACGIFLVLYSLIVWERFPELPLQWAGRRHYVVGVVDATAPSTPLAPALIGTSSSCSSG
jgi:hypothetical protein